MKYTTTAYPDYINEVSEVIGTKRYDDCTAIRKANKDYQRGDQELEIDILGVKGELIASHYLFSKNTEHHLNKLAGGKPISDYDILVNGKKVDVKAIPHYGRFLIVTVMAHHKKPMDYYMFVKPSQNNTADIWLIDYEEVGKWNKKFLGYGDVYCKTINSLT